MKKLSILFLISLIVTQGCRKQSAEAISDISLSTQTPEAGLTAAKEKLVSFIKKQKLINPQGVQNRNVSNQSRGLTPPGLHRSTDRESYVSFIRTAINSDDYECGPTLINQYVGEKVSTWDEVDFEVYNYFSALVFDYAYFYQNSNATGIPYFGDHGQYNNVTSRSFRDLKKFWDIPSDIYITSSHGNFFNDIPKLIAVLELYREYGYLDPAITDAEIVELAQYIKLVFGSSHFQNFLNPLLTFNAFAAPAEPSINSPKKIVMGDGIQQVYFDLGYGDVATQSILAHEYAHQVQFEKLGLDYFVYSPEGTRLTELMADALAGYYLNHARGAAMNWHRVENFLTVFFLIGDCAFSEAYHHGTPLQRMRAARFGKELAANAANQGHILPSMQIINQFLAAYPAIIAADSN